MKKNFTTFFIATMLVVLSGCGEEIQAPNNSDNGKIDPIKGNATVFSCSKGDLVADDGTRTSMGLEGTKVKFYWEAGDYIWVDTLKNGTFTGKSHSIELSTPTQAPSAKFYFRQIVLTEPKYDLTYTGNNSSSGTSVTIAAAQTQSEWNNAAHLGKSGDCGVAEAIRDNLTGIYSFSLKHKASYLIFQPYRAAAITDGWKLKSIEITSDNTIAGKYPFNKTDGIVTTSTITNPSDTIRLTCDDNSDFTLPQSAASDDKSCYMVIQPGTHKLTVRYEIQPTGSVNGVAGGTFYITKEIETTFNVNGAKKIQHELNVLHFRRQSYKWDAMTGYYYGHESSSNESENSIETHEVTSGTTIPTQASRSASTMPNANMMYWFVKNGDPRWDNVTPWTLDAGENVYCAGAWVKRARYMTYYDVEKTDMSHRSNASITNLDLRKRGPWSEQGFSNAINANIGAIRVFTDSSHVYRTGGKPADTSNYFYLPAMGGHSNITGDIVNVGRIGYYWSKSPFPVPGNHNANQYAYYLGVTPERFTLNVAGERRWGMTVNVSTQTHPDGIRYFP